MEERAKAGVKALSDWMRRCRVAVGELRGKTLYIYITCIIAFALSSIYINQSINQHHGLSPMQEVAAIYSEN